MTRPTRATALAVAMILVTFPWAIFGNHSWGGYHWARTQNPFTLKAGDNLSSAWKPYLNQAAWDWSNDPYAPAIPDVVDMVVVTGASNRNCRPTSGQDEVCDAS